MRTYSDFLGSSTKLAMIQYLLIPKQVIVVVRQRQYRKIHKKPSSTPQGKKTSKVNKMREVWDIVVTNAENLWK